MDSNSKVPKQQPPMPAQSTTSLMEQLTATTNKVPATGMDQVDTSSMAAAQAAQDSVRLQQQIAHMHNIQQQALQPNHSENNLGLLFSSYQAWVNNMNNLPTTLGYFGNPQMTTGSQQQQITQQQQQMMPQPTQLPSVPSAATTTIATNSNASQQSQNATTNALMGNSSASNASQFGMVNQQVGGGGVQGGAAGHAAAAAAAIMLNSNSQQNAAAAVTPQTAVNLQQPATQLQFGQQQPTQAQIGQYTTSIPTTQQQQQQTSTSSQASQIQSQAQQQASHMRTQQQQQQQQLPQQQMPPQMQQIHQQLQQHMPTIGSFNHSMDGQFNGRHASTFAGPVGGVTVAMPNLAGVPSSAVPITSANYAMKLQELFFR